MNRTLKLTDRIGTHISLSMSDTIIVYMIVYDSIWYYMIVYDSIWNRSFKNRICAIPVVNTKHCPTKSSASCWTTVANICLDSVVSPTERGTLFAENWKCSDGFLWSFDIIMIWWNSISMYLHCISKKRCNVATSNVSEVLKRFTMHRKTFTIRKNRFLYDKAIWHKQDCNSSPRR